MPQTWRQVPDSLDTFSSLPTWASDDPDLGRFAHEFCEVRAIGRGDFANVYRARHKVDQRVYALKVQSGLTLSASQASWKEASALTLLAARTDPCPNLLRYYDSWFEDSRLHLQLELCECSLRDKMIERARGSIGCDDKSSSTDLGLVGSVVDARFGEEELTLVLREVACGLEALHGAGLVHLDIKPDNILHRDCYKIADFGLAVSSTATRDEVVEGDCRYVSKELLQGRYDHLPKADIFSLGLVCYELLTNPVPLPQNGAAWHRLRNGALDLDTQPLPPLSPPLLALLRSLVYADAVERPLSREVTRQLVELA